MERVILHCDCNNFFASVECLEHPELKQVPMAVAGSPEQRHGIILAKNEIAKAFGVRTAETIGSARKKCPRLVLVRPHHRKYSEYSILANALYRKYTDLVEPFGIDESWLDVTGSRTLFGSGTAIADRIREEMKQQLGLTVSVGVSFNKVFAKLGSDYKKPDATTVITRQNFQSLLWPLPVEDLLGVGHNTLSALQGLGIRTIGQLAAADEKLLRERLGKQGEQLWRSARGEDTSPVRPWGEAGEVKSVGNGLTFDHDLTEEGEIRTHLLLLADSVASRLRKCGRKCRTLQLAVKAPNFSVIQRQMPLPFPTWLAADLAENALWLLHKNWATGMPIRALTVTAASLIAPEDIPVQFRLDGEEDERRQERRDNAAAAMDRLRERYGQQIISFGSLLRNDAEEPENQ